jgi:hypothetical protein
MSAMLNILILPLNMLTSNRVHPVLRGSKSKTLRHKERITWDKGPEIQDMIILTLEDGDR